MEKRDIEDLRDRVACAAVLEQAGYVIDTHESTRRALKYRRGSRIIIVIHGGRGWFDPLSDAKGDIFSLVEHISGIGFVAALKGVADLIGFALSEPAWVRNPRGLQANRSIGERWHTRRRLWPGSTTWRYLSGERCLPDFILHRAIKWDLLREGPRGSMWAGHTDADGTVIGWEARGPDWRGFATGGSKTLFRFGAMDAARICVTEAAIDAMSLAAIEGIREGSLYLSTGGGWSPTTEAALRLLASRPGAQLIAATDANPQGEAFACRLREIAGAVDCDWMRLRPSVEDWNEVLKRKTLKEREIQKW